MSASDDAEKCTDGRPQLEEHPIAACGLFSLGEWELVCARLALSSRQAEIIARILCGQSDQKIARCLGISMPTVRAHLKRAFESLEVNDRVSLVVRVFTTLRSLETV